MKYPTDSTHHVLPFYIFSPIASSFGEPTRTSRRQGTHRGYFSLQGFQSILHSPLVQTETSESPRHREVPLLCVRTLTLLGPLTQHQTKKKLARVKVTSGCPKSFVIPHFYESFSCFMNPDEKTVAVRLVTAETPNAGNNEMLCPVCKVAPRARDRHGELLPGCCRAHSGEIVRRHQGPAGLIFICSDPESGHRYAVLAHEFRRGGHEVAKDVLGWFGGNADPEEDLKFTAAREAFEETLGSLCVISCPILSFHFNLVLSFSSCLVFFQVLFCSVYYLRVPALVRCINPNRNFRIRRRTVGDAVRRKCLCTSDSSHIRSVTRWVDAGATQQFGLWVPASPQARLQPVSARSSEHTLRALALARVFLEWESGCRNPGHWGWSRWAVLAANGIRQFVQSRAREPWEWIEQTVFGHGQPNPLAKNPAVRLPSFPPPWRPLACVSAEHYHLPVFCAGLV